MYDQTGKATADCAYVPRAIGEVNVRSAQTGALELVALIRLESGLAVPKLNDLPRTPRRKDREASWPASLSGENAKFFCAGLALAGAARAGGGEG